MVIKMNCNGHSCNKIAEELGVGGTMFYMK